ncbi:hypothetical protein, conserved [Angomonas deanei]|uniref:Uncharacterized protein n=1 Tax=Angomonas deanei TaxID=59799 RepID=A0A7G2CUA5_9TRYP|nr:hypothetical protein, conserved [Angomonas deanei]
MASLSIQQLLEENAQLRTRLELSPTDRVVNEIVATQIRNFFSDAQDRARNLSNTLGEENTDDEKADARTAASVLLLQLNGEKEEMLKQMETIYTSEVQPRNERIEALEKEKETLREKINELQMASAAAPPLAIVSEVKQLRETEALLRQHLEESQKKLTEVSQQFSHFVEEGVESNRGIPKYVENVETLRHLLSEVQTSRQALQEESKEKLLQLAEVQKIELSNAHQQRMQAEEKSKELDSLFEMERQKNHQLELEKQTLANRVAELEEINRAQEALKESEVNLSLKRVRPEGWSTENPSSIREELLQFWYDSQETIKQLTQKLSDREGKEKEVRMLRHQLVTTDRKQKASASHLVELESEVQSVRDELLKSRASCAGLEAERDLLMSSLSRVVGSDVNQYQINDCIRRIGVAASQAAASNTALVADPKELDRCAREAQSLKSEIRQLQRQKDNLNRFIEQCHQRIQVILQRELLHDGGNHSSSPTKTTNAVESDTTSLHDTTGLMSTPEGTVHTHPFQSNLSITKVLDYITQCARDIFTSCERSVYADNTFFPGAIAASSNTNGGFLPVKLGGSFTSLKSELFEAETKLEITQKRLQWCSSECSEVRHSLEQERVTHAQAIASREEEISGLRTLNNDLTRQLSIALNQLKKLKEEYGNIVRFADQASSSLSIVVSVLQTESAKVGSLRDMVQEERRGMVQLLSREADSWMETTRAAELASVTDAMRRLSDYVEECISRAALTNEEERTHFIQNLAEAIRRQETRIREVEKSYEEATKQQGESLATRIEQLHANWDTVWKSKLLSESEERIKLLQMWRADSNLHRIMERTSLLPPEAPSEIRGGSFSAREALDAVKALSARLMEEASQPQVESQNTMEAAVSAPEAPIPNLPEAPQEKPVENEETTQENVEDNQNKAGEQDAPTTSEAIKEEETHESEANA